jgi:hypothetical protein
MTKRVGAAPPPHSKRKLAWSTDVGIRLQSAGHAAPGTIQTHSFETAVGERRVTDSFARDTAAFRRSVHAT